MNKKAIWIIIGMMGAALIGIGWLQSNWISFSINLNEEQFDKSVFAALNKVAERLEYEEQLHYLNFIDNGYVQSFLQEAVRQETGNGTVTLNRSIQQQIAKQPTVSKQELISMILNDGECDCVNCQANRVQKTTQFMQLYEGLDYVPVADRIELERLHAYLQQALRDQGVDIEYRYGVFSRKKRSFVIADNHFVVEDRQPQVTKEGYNNLSTSKYRVSLFKQQDGQFPGLLMVYFPDRASYVWSSVWKTLLAGLLFTGIILFCFAYTIHVIFQQKKLSEMKTDFINNMTHEFKTPIATISLAADSITSPMISGDSSKVGRFADIIKQENKRMNNQVEKVLQMALIDKRDFNLKLTQINIHEVIEQAVQNVSLQVDKRGGEAYAEFGAENPVIEGDLTHVSNMINNLLDNANKYTTDSPEIVVSTRNVPNGIEVTITDNGIGMSKEARKHIFDRFYRVHTGDLHDVKGFGLGLSYVKAMITAHKGQIDVKSELGKGSSFILTFPFHVESKPMMV